MARKGILSLKSLKEQASNYIRDYHVQENFLKKYYKRAESASEKKE